MRSIGDLLSSSNSADLQAANKKVQMTASRQQLQAIVY